jgi:hypothetical protein
MIELLAILLICITYYTGYTLSRRRELKRQRLNMEKNIGKEFKDILDKAVPNERKNRWN